MRKQWISIVVLLSALSASTAFAVDEYDGEGDTQSRPDVWVAPMESENGNTADLVMPGDNQPSTSQMEGNREIINFDTDPSPDSEIVITPDDPAE